MDRVSNCTPGYDIIYDPIPPAINGNPLGSKGDERGFKLRIVFFSSAPIGIPFLQALYDDDRFEIIGIVTQPDQPSGRGLEIKPNIIKSKALELGINNIAAPNTLKLESKKYPGEGEQFQSWLQNLHPDYIVVIAYGKIVPQHILDIPSIAPVNIHGSILPKYRGASPIQTSLLNADAETGITIIRMTAGLDEGDILDILPIELKPTTTTKDLIDAFAIQGPKFTNKTLVDFSQGKIKPMPQDSSQATFTKKIEKEDGLVDIYHDSLNLVVRKHNAYYLRPKIYFEHQGKRIIIEDISIDLQKYNISKPAPIADSDHNTNKAILNLLIKPEGKKTMTREDRKRGIKN